MRRSQRAGYGNLPKSQAIIPPRTREVNRQLLPENDPLAQQIYSPEELEQMARDREWAKSLERAPVSIEERRATQSRLASTRHSMEQATIAVQRSNRQSGRRERRLAAALNPGDHVPSEADRFSSQVYAGGKAPAPVTTQDVLYSGSDLQPIKQDIQPDIQPIHPRIPPKDWTPDVETPTREPHAKLETVAVGSDSPTQGPTNSADSTDPQESSFAKSGEHTRGGRKKSGGLAPVPVEVASKVGGGGGDPIFGNTAQRNPRK